LRHPFFIAVISTFFFSFGPIGSKKVIGHWTCEVDLFDMKENDTLVFTKINYSDKLYQWSGALAGVEFTANNHFSEYHNVLCSSETNPIRYSDEKWMLHNDLITIIGNTRSVKWRIMHVTSKKMKVVVLKTNNNE